MIGWHRIRAQSVLTVQRGAIGDGATNLSDCPARTNTQQHPYHAPPSSSQPQIARHRQGRAFAPCVPANRAETNRNRYIPMAASL